MEVTVETVEKSENIYMFLLSQIFLIKTEKNKKESNYK